MNGFIKTIAFGLAALCLVLLAGAGTALLVAKSRGAFDPAALRQVVLSEEERKYLAAMKERSHEPAEAPARAEREDEMLSRIAELANADHASRLVADLRRQKQTLDERQTWIDQQEADLRLAKADLERLKGQLDGRLRQVQDETTRQQTEHQRWAAAALEEAKQVDAIRQVELDRAKEQVKIFESMKEGAWQSLRRFAPRDIARYLYLMDPKRAAKVLATAEADKENPDITLAIHRAYLRLDVAGMTGDQIKHLARLYSFMTPEAIVSSLRQSTLAETAEVLSALENPKKVADVLALVRAEDPGRETEIQKLLAQSASTPR
jgi:hypothetical protein